MNKNFGKPVALEKTWKRPIRNRIYRIGLELEGGWNKLPSGVKPIRDGSVTDFPEDLSIPCRYIGEIPSHALDLSGDNSWEPWLRKMYPDGIGVRCGFHIHVSFKELINYGRCIDRDYPATVVQYFRQWATEKKFPDNHWIWPRLNNLNEYCKHQFDADGQLEETHKRYMDQGSPRYTVINYCARNGTIELRLLPMFASVDDAVEAVKLFLKVTNGFLVATAKRELKLKSEYGIELEADREIHVSRI